MSKCLLNLKLFCLLSILFLCAGITQATNLFRSEPAELAVGWGPNKYFPIVNNPNRKISVAILLPSLPKEDKQIHKVPVVVILWDDKQVVAMYRREASYYNGRGLVVSHDSNEEQMGQFIINVNTGVLEFTPVRNVPRLPGHSFENMKRSTYEFLTIKPQFTYEISIKEEPPEFKIGGFNERRSAEVTIPTKDEGKGDK